MLKKTIAFILVLMAIISVLVSCTGSGNSDVNSLNNSSTVSESSTATSKEASSSASVSDETSSEASSETEASKEESSDAMTSLINGYLDTILDGIDRLDFGSYENEAGLAEKYPSQTAALVNLGEDAFPVLDGIISETDILTRRAFAEYIKYKIKPELHDLDFPSPDGKYSIKASVYTFLYTGSTAKIYGDIRLVDNATKNVLVTSDLAIPDSEIQISWSTDSKFSAVSSGFLRYFTQTDIFDVQDKSFIKMPSAEQVSIALAHEFSYDNYYGIHFKLREWLPDNKVKIKILTTISATQGGTGEGWYIYDLKANKIIDSHYEITEQPSE